MPQIYSGCLCWPGQAPGIRGAVLLPEIRGVGRLCAVPPGPRTRYGLLCVPPPGARLGGRLLGAEPPLRSHLRFPQPPHAPPWPEPSPSPACGCLPRGIPAASCLRETGKVRVGCRLSGERGELTLFPDIWGCSRGTEAETQDSWAGRFSHPHSGS